MKQMEMTMQKLCTMNFDMALVSIFKYNF